MDAKCVFADKKFYVLKVFSKDEEVFIYDHQNHKKPLATFNFLREQRIKSEENS